MLCKIENMEKDLGYYVVASAILYITMIGKARTKSPVLLIVGELNQPISNCFILF